MYQHGNKVLKYKLPLVYIQRIVSRLIHNSINLLLHVATHFALYYRKCPDVLDEGDKSKWEEIILSFLKASQIKVALL